MLKPCLIVKERTGKQNAGYFRDRFRGDNGVSHWTHYVLPSQCKYRRRSFVPPDEMLYGTWCFLVPPIADTKLWIMKPWFTRVKFPNAATNTSSICTCIKFVSAKQRKQDSRQKQIYRRYLPRKTQTLSCTLVLQFIKYSTSFSYESTVSLLRWIHNALNST